MSPRIPPHLLWPGMVVLITGMSFYGAYSLFNAAAPDDSFAVEPNAYDQGLNWDLARRQLAASRELAWTADIAVQPTGNDRALLTVILRDAHGSPVADAELLAVAFHDAAAAIRFDLIFTEPEPGTYVAAIGSARPGLWTLNATATRLQDAFIIDRPLTMPDPITDAAAPE